MNNNHPKLSLVEHFKNLPDPRIDRQREHDLVNIMVIAVCTLICVGETFNDMEDFGRAKEDWFRTFLRLPNGIPSHDTFNRVFAALDPREFLDCFLRWTQSLRRALDGDQNVKYIVSAWAKDNSLALGQLKVADKSNEITALPELLRVRIKRLHRDDGRNGLPEEDRPGDYRSGCRLCAGPQRHPGKGA